MQIALPGLMAKRRRIATTEPITWTQRTSNFGTAYMAAGAYGSDGVYTIVGGYEASGPSCRAITQTDPTSAWTLNTSTGLSNYFENGLLFDGTNWVSSSTNQGIAHTTDATSSWTGLSNGISVSGIAYNGSLYVCGDGNANKFWTASSASGTWTERTNPLGANRIYTAGWDGTYWVVAGAAGKMEYATDATSGSWTTISSPFGTSLILSLAFGNGYWVAVAADGKLATCPTNATGTWTLHGTSSFGSDTIRSVAYANNAWAACGSAGKIGTCGATPTGTWTQRTSSFGGSDTLWTIFYGDGYWVCGGGDGEEGLVATAVPGS